jgi:exosortase
MNSTCLDAPAPARLDHLPPPSPALRVWLGVNVVLLALLFGSRFLGLFDAWTQDPNYSHGPLVPILSGWLAWRCSQRVGRPTQGEVGWGATGILLGCLIHLASLVGDWALLDYVALVAILWGLAVTAGGRQWARGFAFPILFLFFMFPLPKLWTAWAALRLQDWVSATSAAVLDLFTVCYRRGNSLYLAGVADPLVVAAECSGLRQIVAFVALAALVGFLGQRSFLGRTLLIVAAVPVAILANVVRVLLMAGGACFFGTDWLSGWLHGAPALVTLPLGLGLFALVAGLLGRLEKTPVPEEPARS